MQETPNALGRCVLDLMPGAGQVQEGGATVKGDMAKDGTGTDRSAAWSRRGRGVIGSGAEDRVLFAFDGLCLPLHHQALQAIFSVAPDISNRLAPEDSSTSGSMDPLGNQASMHAPH